MKCISKSQIQHLEVEDFHKSFFEDDYNIIVITSYSDLYSMSCKYKTLENLPLIHLTVERY